MIDEPASLNELFDDLAQQLGAVDVVAAGDGSTEYRRGPRTYAVVNADGSAEVRLHPEVAEAAGRTPSTFGSPRGHDWVRFAPPELEQHALDRAEAWFLSAWRAAQER